MKRGIQISLIVLLLFGIVGCTPKETPDTTDSQKQEEEKQEESEAQEPKEPVVGLFKGNIPPPIASENMEGEIIGFENYGDKVIFLNFWATWCKWCEYEMPDLESFYRDHKEEVVVLGLDVGEERDKIKPFLEEYDVTFPVLLDPVGRVSNTYRVDSLPITYIIDKEGIIQFVHIGAMERAQMESYLKEIKED